MKIRNIEQLTDFLKVIDSCKGDVYLTSVYGDRYNLKSAMTQYIAIAAFMEMNLKYGVISRKTKVK